MNQLTVDSILDASKRLENLVRKTPLEKNDRFSELVKGNVFFKREDRQKVRSYKINGAANAISMLSEEERDKGIVCSSAGNHAQGVAESCNLLGIKGVIYMPKITPNQKVKKTQEFGGDFVEVKLFGDTFDETSTAAKEFSKEKDSIFIHPFDDLNVIAGQGNVGVSLFEQMQKEKKTLDYLFLPIGGGGLLSGVGTYIKSVSPHTKIIGIEPDGAPSMTKALQAGKPVTLRNIDTFVDGAAVKRVGDLTYTLSKDLLDDILLIKNDDLKYRMRDLFDEGIVTEPAGALSVAGLYQMKEELEDKNSICVISGGNIDNLRFTRICNETQYYGLDHYFTITLPERPQALLELLTRTSNPEDNIITFHYDSNNSRQAQPMIGIEFGTENNYQRFLDILETDNYKFKETSRSEILGY